MATIVGATTLGTGYSTTRSGAVSVFDGRLSRTMAGRLQKYYWAGEGSSNWPTTASGLPSEWTSLMAISGIGLINCIRPSRSAVTTGGSTLTNEKNAVKAFLDLLRANSPAGGMHGVVLWNECNQAAQGWFTESGGTGVPSYIDYWNAYAPAIVASTTERPQGSWVLYDPLIATSSAGDNVQTAVQMYPTAARSSTTPTKVVIDWYGDAHKAGIDPGNTYGGDSVVSLSNTLGVPFGLGEWGVSADGHNIDTNPTYGNPSSYSNWTSYVNKLTSIFSTRITNHNPNSDLVYFSGENTSGANNVNAVDGNGNPDYKVAGIQSVFDTFDGT